MAMAWSKRNLVISCVFVVLSVFFVPTYGQTLNLSQRGTNQTRARVGICNLEVPTVDILAPEDRVGGIPRGNGSRVDLTRIQICCQGYERVPRTFLHCQPICEKGCENGNCTAPNVCTCKHGFIKPAENPNKCIPTCPIGCLNGVCTTRGMCDCNRGYRHSNDGKYCLPFCTGGCGDAGRCVGPETCSCSPGFEVNRDTNKCEYYCKGGCGHGSCVGPNKCSCNPGYKLTATSCEPDCSRGCKNGVCSAPNTCTCKSGWSLDRTGTECVPHCSSPCLNADCVAPETCACKRGYTESPGSGAHRCVAFCEDGCENGVCTMPNFCICNAGFIKEAKGSNRCIRRVRRSVLTDLHLELIPEEVLEGH